MFNSRNVVNASARKLMVHQSGQFWATSPGVDVLSALPAKAPLSLVSIIGSSRGGKSTLLNCLAGGSIFNVSNSWGTPCTAGVDISSYTMLRDYLLDGKRDGKRDGKHDDRSSPYDALESSSKLSPSVLQCPEAPGSPMTPIGRRKSSLRESYVGFVDVEGQGDRDSLFDVNLALPILVSSAVVIFNWHGPLQRNTLLDGLGTLAKAGRCFDSETDGTDTKCSVSPPPANRRTAGSFAITTEEVAVDSSSSYARTTTSRWSNVQQMVAPPFGHLKIVARDANNFDDDPKHMKEAWNRLMEEEAESVAEPDSTEAQEIRRRNSIRQTLRESFRSISFHPLPRIVDNLDLHKRNPKGIPEKLISTGFREAVMSLRSDIYDNTTTPFTYKSLVLTGPRMRTLIEKVVEFVNQGNFSVGGLWQSMQADMIQRYRDTALQLFDDLLATMRTKLPFFVAESLEMRLQAAKSRALEEFNSLCHSLDPSSNTKSDDVVDRLTIEMTKECDSLRRENQTILQEHTLYMRDVVERLTPHIVGKIRDVDLWPLEFSTITEWINDVTNAALVDFRIFLNSKPANGTLKGGDIKTGTNHEAEIQFETFVTDRLTKTSVAEFARVSGEMLTRRSLEDKISRLEKYEGVMGALDEQKKKMERMRNISVALSGQNTQGFLSKRGQRAVWSVWNRRYCVLTINGIKYFKLSRSVASGLTKTSAQGAQVSLPPDLRPRRVVDLTPDTQIVVHCDLDDDEGPSSVMVSGDTVPLQRQDITDAQIEDEIKILEAEEEAASRNQKSAISVDEDRREARKQIIGLEVETAPTKSSAKKPVTPPSTRSVIVKKEKNLFRMSENEFQPKRRRRRNPMMIAVCGASTVYYTFSIRVPLTPLTIRQRTSTSMLETGAQSTNTEVAKSPSSPKKKHRSADRLPSNNVRTTRDFTFRTESREECRMWVHALREVVDFLRFGGETP